jgi:hypothetical protein
MSPGITWYTLAEAESKSGVKQEEILQWIDDGLTEIRGSTTHSVKSRRFWGNRERVQNQQ